MFAGVLVIDLTVSDGEAGDKGEWARVRVGLGVCVVGQA